MMVTTGARGCRFSSASVSPPKPSSTSASDTRLGVWPNSRTMSSAVSASMTSLILCMAPCPISSLMRSTARSVMRLESSWMVITSGMITSRMTLSRGCTTPAWRSFSRSRRRLREASERSRCASSKALLMVSLMRSRRSSPVLTGLLGGLAPFFLARNSSSASASTSRARGPRLAICSGRRGASPALAFSGWRDLASSTTGAGAVASTLASVGGCSTAGGGGSCTGSGLGRNASRRMRSASSASARSRSSSSARRRASSSLVERPPSCESCASSDSSVSTSPPPGAEIVRFFFFSTTTDFDRPWLKLCLTWPASTVRFRLSGLRGAAPRSVFSVASFVSVMHVLCWF